MGQWPILALIAELWASGPWILPSELQSQSPHRPLPFFQPMLLCWHGNCSMRSHQYQVQPLATPAPITEVPDSIVAPADLSCASATLPLSYRYRSLTVGTGAESWW